LEVTARTGDFEAGALRRALEDGQRIGTRPGRFTEGYYPVPREMQILFSRVGITTLRTVASEGIAATLDESALDVWSDGAAFEELLSICVQTAEEPTLEGATTHMLLVGRKGLHAP
ncbi:MAG: hypothetical protein M3506_06580, partial [Chloroflexota bacterium]|nr:hypothetical protein [Chloroflexota bacterium]